MSVNIGGVLYENKVKDAIKEIALPHLEILDDHSGAFNRHTNDLMLSVHGVQHDIEIKKSNAQMGEGSYVFEGTNFSPANDKMDSGISEMIINEVLLKRTDELNRLIGFIQKQDPISYHNEIVSIPFRATKAAWQKVMRAELTKPIQGKLEFNESMIHNHYQKKGVNYIQIEKRGLFYLAKNPLNLPIPQLIADVKIEVRMKRAGSTMVQKLGEKVASVTLISAGRLRLRSCPKSPYSLDDKDSIRRLFA